VIAVLASRFDETVMSAVATWRATTELVVVTADDLLSPGWFLPTRRAADARFVADGRPFAVRDLHGVINLMSRVHDFEMLGIRRRDRSYVSAELWAMLVWWLHALPCAVLNRPTPGCLNGPLWNQEQWLSACRRANIPTLSGDNPITPGVSRAAREPRTTTVVCGTAFGDCYPTECATLSKLAAADFLEVVFVNVGNSWCFRAVNLMPPIERAEVRDWLSHILFHESEEVKHGAALGTSRGQSD
jgi:hypothetical protein